jgi:putative flavoprotein involved in K+ transport
MVSARSRLTSENLIETPPPGMNEVSRPSHSCDSALILLTLNHYLGGRTVLDTGKYRHALETGRIDRRPMFTAFGADYVLWPDDTRKQADTVLFATGYRPDLDYLRSLGALDDDGMPRQTGGIPITHPGLVYLGLEFQRSFSSNTLRGVHRDASHVIPALTAHVRGAPAAAGPAKTGPPTH